MYKIDFVVAQQFDFTDDVLVLHHQLGTSNISVDDSHFGEY